MNFKEIADSVARFHQECRDARRENHKRLACTRFTGYIVQNTEYVSKIQEQVKLLIKQEKAKGTSTPIEDFKIDLPFKQSDYGSIDEKARDKIYKVLTECLENVDAELAKLNEKYPDGNAHQNLIDEIKRAYEKIKADIVYQRMIASVVNDAEKIDLEDREDEMTESQKNKEFIARLKDAHYKAIEEARKAKKENELLDADAKEYNAVVKFVAGKDDKALLSLSAEDKKRIVSAYINFVCDLVLERANRHHRKIRESDAEDVKAAIKKEKIHSETFAFDPIDLHNLRKAYKLIRKDTDSADVI